MMRPDHELHEIDPSEWTKHEAFSHLSKTFEIACRDYPEVMEPHATRATFDSLSRDEATRLMRAALRDTFQQRWPNRFAQPTQEAAG